MRSILVGMAVFAALSMFGPTGCQDRDRADERGRLSRPAEVRGPHERDAEARHGREGHSEDSGRELTADDTYDEVRNGVRLKLAYDREAKSFRGTVENTTGKTLRRVRVEVRLSNGTEVGPTTPSDLAPGEKRSVELRLAVTDFDTWTAHAEVGSGEHGHGEDDGEARGEHDGDGSGEHGRDGHGEHGDERR